MRMMTQTLNIALLALMLSTLCWAAPSKPQSFSSPEEATKALARALQSKNKEAMMALFGPDYRRLEAQDPAERVAAVDRLNRLFKEGWSLTTNQDQQRVIRVGYEGWSFPVPLVKTGSTWSFNTLAGEQEIANRRIGRNELLAIETCQLLVQAQNDFKKKNSSYATELLSSPGKKDGLYWATAKGEEASPLYKAFGNAADFMKTRHKGAAWYGYYYHLTPTSDGYVIKAWPASPGRTGVMSFWVDQSGQVYEKDLGATAGSELRSQDATSNPQGWTKVGP